MEKELEGQTTPTDEVQKVVEEKTSEKTEQTISDVADVKKNDIEGTKEKKSSVFSEMLSYKKESRENKRLLKEKEEELEKLRKSNVESPDIDSFAEKWDVPREFVEGLFGLKKGKPQSNEVLQEEVLQATEEIKSFNEKRKEEEQRMKLDNAIEKEFSRVMTSNPDYKDFVSKDAVKSYALNNISKSMEQIIFDLYGNLINSKNKNIEDYSPSGKNYGKEINFDNPTEEEAQAIMKNPKLKKEYDSNLIKRLKESNR